MRIEKYPKDLVITANDMVIGTDGDNENQTKNFPIWQLSQLILGQLKHSGLVLQFADGTNPEIQIGAEGYFFTEGNLISKSQVTKFYFSETTLFGENLTALLNSVGSNLGELYVGITQTNDAGNYGFFNILSVDKVANYFEIGVDLRGTLFSKTFQAEENYSLLFDLATNEYTIEAEGSSVHIYRNGVKVDTAVLTVNPDDINLSRLISGSVDDNGIATFVRDDDTTFTVDFGGFLGSAIPQRTSDLINDGEGTGSPFITDAYTKSEIDSKDAVLQGQIDLNADDIAILQNIDIRFDAQTSKLELYDGANVLLAQADVTLLDNEATQLDYDPVGKTLLLKGQNGNILDSVPVASFASELSYKLQFNSIDTNQLELVGGDGSVVSFVNIEISNIANFSQAVGDIIDNELVGITIPISETALTADSTESDVRFEVAKWLSLNGLSKQNIQTISWNVVDDTLTLYVYSDYVALAYVD